MKKRKEPEKERDGTSQRQPSPDTEVSMFGADHQPAIGPIFSSAPGFVNLNRPSLQPSATSSFLSWRQPSQQPRPRQQSSGTAEFPSWWWWLSSPDQLFLPKPSTSALPHWLRPSEKPPLKRTSNSVLPSSPPPLSGLPPLQRSSTSAFNKWSPPSQPPRPRQEPAGSVYSNWWDPSQQIPDASVDTQLKGLRVDVQEVYHRRQEGGGVVRGALQSTADEVPPFIMPAQWYRDVIAASSGRVSNFLTRLGSSFPNRSRSPNRDATAVAGLSKAAENRASDPAARFRPGGVSTSPVQISSSDRDDPDGEFSAPGSGRGRVGSPDAAVSSRSGGSGSDQGDIDDRPFVWGARKSRGWIPDAAVRFLYGGGGGGPSSSIRPSSENRDDTVSGPSGAGAVSADVGVLPGKDLGPSEKTTGTRRR